MLTDKQTDIHRWKQQNFLGSGN